MSDPEREKLLARVDAYLESDGVTPIAYLLICDLANALRPAGEFVAKSESVAPWQQVPKDDYKTVAECLARIHQCSTPDPMAPDETMIYIANLCAMAMKMMTGKPYLFGEMSIGAAKSVPVVPDDVRADIQHLVDGHHLRNPIRSACCPDARERLGFFLASSEPEGSRSSNPAEDET